MRLLFVGLAALLLSACDSEETYQMAPIEAFTALSGIGTPSGMSPLPGGLSPVSVNVESVPADNSVQWLFTHEGDDIARIVARVTPDGDTASTVTVKYVEGQAPGQKWRNDQARQLIRDQVQRLVVEAVDSTLEKRPYNEALRNEVRHQVTLASVGSIMSDVSASMDAEIRRRKEREDAYENSVPSNPHSATKPTTDLGKYNN
jgi:hypothetical protein